MPIFRFHFSERICYFNDVRAESLKEAKESINYVGVHHQTDENSNYLEDKCITQEDECFDNDEQWESVADEDVDPRFPI